MKIEIAKKEDIERIMSYFKENDNNIREEDKYCGDFIERRVRYYIENSFIALVKDKGKIIGHAFFQVKENPNLGVGEIETVNVHPSYRGKGIGTELIKETIKFAKNFFEERGINPKCIYLMTRSDNETAIRVYEKMGFKKQNTIGRIFHKNQLEELVMTLFFD